MKKLIFFLTLMLMATPVFAVGDIVVRSGDFIDQYKIDDLGGEYDNHLIFVSHRVDEVVVQQSSTNFNTYSESFLCWSDSEEPLCPDDDIDLVTPGIQYRMPTIMALEEIFVSGGSTTGADLTDLQEKTIYLAFWHEYRTKKLITDSIAEMVAEGLNETQQRRGLKFIYFSQGIDLTTAQSLANDRITNSIIATYDDYNLATVPLQDRRLLKLFGEVGWFE